MNLTTQKLNTALWAAADVMRKTMTADVYKDYLLGLVFYKALSDRMLVEAYDQLTDEKPKSLDEAQAEYAKATQDKEIWPDLQYNLMDTFGCVILPEHTFLAFYEQINNRTFLLDNLQQAFRNVESAGGGYLLRAV